MTENRSYKLKPLLIIEMQEVLKLFGRQRRTEEETLGHVAVSVFEKVQAFQGFHTFGDDFNLQFVAHVNDRGDDGAVSALQIRVADEDFVDFQCVDMEEFQMNQGRVSGPEIV